MIGFPFETEEDFNQTIQVIDRIGFQKHPIDIGLFLYTPNPGTDLYDELVAEGKYQPFSSLQEWGEKCDYQYAVNEWINSRLRGEFELLTYLVWFAFGTAVQRKMKPVPRMMHKLLSIDAKIRWKYKIYKLPIEWKILQRIIKT